VPRLELQVCVCFFYYYYCTNEYLIKDYATSTSVDRRGGRGLRPTCLEPLGMFFFFYQVFNLLTFI
jgi:hypothetical protein